MKNFQAELLSPEKGTLADKVKIFCRLIFAFLNADNDLLVAGRYQMLKEILEKDNKFDIEDFFEQIDSDIANITAEKITNKLSARLNELSHSSLTDRKILKGIIDEVKYSINVEKKALFYSGDGTSPWEKMIDEKNPESLINVVLEKVYNKYGFSVSDRYERQYLRDFLRKSFFYPNNPPGFDNRFANRIFVHFGPNDISDKIISIMMRDENNLLDAIVLALKQDIDSQDLAIVIEDRNIYMNKPEEAKKFFHDARCRFLSYFAGKNTDFIYHTDRKVLLSFIDCIDKIVVSTFKQDNNLDTIDKKKLYLTMRKKYPALCKPLVSQLPDILDAINQMNAYEFSGLFAVPPTVKENA